MTIQEGFQAAGLMSSRFINTLQVLYIPLRKRFYVFIIILVRFTKALKGLLKIVGKIEKNLSLVWLLIFNSPF